MQSSPRYSTLNFTSIADVWRHHVTTPLSSCEWPSHGKNSCAHAGGHAASECHYLESPQQASLRLCDPCYSLLASASVHAITILVGCINCKIVSFRCQCTAWACCSGTSWSSPCQPAAAASERPQQLASNSDAKSERCVLSTCCRCSMANGISLNANLVCIINTTYNLHNT